MSDNPSRSNFSALRALFENQERPDSSLDGYLARRRGSADSGFHEFDPLLLGRLRQSPNDSYLNRHDPEYIRQERQLNRLRLEELNHWIQLGESQIDWMEIQECLRFNQVNCLDDDCFISDE